jgi:phosphonate degradation associated HDIG domain protein
MSVDDVVGLYAERGAAQYSGEAVSQLEHALQCAALAERAGAAPELVAASFLHDLGHLLAERPHQIGTRQDDQHERRAAALLATLFAPAVVEPIRWHVDAKRYLCCVEQGYCDGLSPASRHSLALQGGVFDGPLARRFAALPFAKDAVRLRRWDDLAKTPAVPTPPLAHYAKLLRLVARI